MSRVAFAVALWLGASAASAAIAFVATTGDGCEASNATSLTCSKVIASGSDRWLNVGVGVEDPTAADRLVASVTFNTTESLVLSVADANSDNDHSESWSLNDPSVTTANVVATLGGTCQIISMVAINYTGVDSVGATNSGVASSGTTFSISLTTTVADNWVVEQVTNGNDGTALASTSGLTERADYATGSTRVGCYDLGPNASGSIAANLSGASSRWGVTIIELKPVVVGGASIVPILDSHFRRWKG